MAEFSQSEVVVFPIFRVFHLLCRGKIFCWSNWEGHLWRWGLHRVYGHVNLPISATDFQCFQCLNVSFSPSLKDKLPTILLNFFSIRSSSDIHYATWAYLVKLQFSFCSPSVVEAGGNRRPLPARLLYSGFSLKSRLEENSRNKTHSKVLSEVLSLQVQSIQRRDFSGFQSLRLHHCQRSSLQVSVEGVRTLQDHIIFGKKIFQDQKLLVRRL